MNFYLQKLIAKNDAIIDRYSHRKAVLKKSKSVLIDFNCKGKLTFIS